MTPAQVREARRLLGITQVRLSVLAGVPAHIVGIYERTGRVPTSSVEPLDSVEAVRQTLEEAGVTFDIGDPGVKLRVADQ